MLGFKLEAKTIPKRQEKLEFQTLKDMMSTPTISPYRNPPPPPLEKSHCLAQPNLPTDLIASPGDRAKGGLW